MRRHPSQDKQAGQNALERALTDLNWIRRTADDRCEHEIRTVGRAYEDLPAPQRERHIAKACQPHRAIEAALTRQLAAQLDDQTRRAIFDRTLDPHFLPENKAKDVPTSLQHVILD
jgi:hypothetical protein